MNALVPYSHQIKGKNWLIDRKLALLGDKPGVGKTAQAVLAACQLQAKAILVVCPNILRENWLREFRMWWDDLFAPLPGIVMVDGVPGKHPASEIVIINYEKLSLEGNVWHSYVLSRKWDVVILDEAHALKTPISKRTKAIYGKILKRNPASKTSWFALSGTFAPNHAGELYSHLRALFPDRITDSNTGKPMTQTAFEDKFCRVVEGRFGRSVVGSKNTDQLRSILKDIYLSRTMDNTLPPLTFREQYITLKPTSAQIRDALDGASRTLREAVGDTEDDDEIMANLGGGDVQLSSQRRVFGVLKAPAVAELVSTELEGNHEKRIVFAWHREVIGIITKELIPYGAVCVDGSTSPADAQAAVDSFQSDPETRVFVGQLQKCGEGLTLTASHHVIFAEPSWVPKDNYQGAKRASRIGQRKAVLARFIVAAGTIDEIIMRVVMRKSQMLADLFGKADINLKTDGPKEYFL